ncbi:MAG: bile acid:sodium symporter [Spirochaetes bacterium]|nr:bile acid:sodium symporter [Spirochaetota bacterium]
MRPLLAVANFLHHQFPVVMLTMLVVGLGVPAIAAFLNPLLLYILMVVLFFNFLRIDFGVLLDEVRSWPYQLYLAAYTLLLFPVGIFYFGMGITRAFGLPPEIPLAVLLYFASPTAAVAPTLALVFKGRFERTLLNLILTSLLVPFTLPFLVWALRGETVRIDYLHMAERLTLMVFVPFVASLFARRVLPGFTAKVSPYAPSFSIAFLSLLTIGGMAGVRPVLMNETGKVALVLVLITGLMVVAFIVSWFLSFKKDRADRLTVSLATTWINVTLTLVVAQEFFRQTAPLVVVIIALSFIPWNLTFLVAKPIIKRIMREEGNGPGDTAGGGDRT